MATTTTTSGNVQEFAPEFRPLASQIGAGAEAQLTRGYVPYDAARLAGMTPDQLAVYGGIKGLQTPSQFAEAGTALADAQRAVTGIGAFGTPEQMLQAQIAMQGAQGSAAAPGALTGFINPFNANVTDISARQMMRDFEAQKAARDYGFAKSGAMGGSRQAFSESEAQRNMNQQLQDVQMKGNAAAYQAAIDQFNQERNRQLQSGQALGGLGRDIWQGNLSRDQLLADVANQERNRQLQAGQALTTLGQTARQTDLSTLGAQATAAGAQQELNQRQLDLDYQDFLNQRDWAKNQLSWGSGILQGSAGAGTSTSTQTQQAPDPNRWAQLLGAGATIAGTGNMLGWW